MRKYLQYRHAYVSNIEIDTFYVNTKIRRPLLTCIVTNHVEL